MGSKPKKTSEQVDLEVEQGKELAQQQQAMKAQQQQMMQRRIGAMRQMQGGGGAALPSLLKGLSPTTPTPKKEKAPSPTPLNPTNNILG